MCQPCANQGHSYRLVRDEADRQYRVEIWAAFHKTHNITDKAAANIPHWQNLNRPVTQDEAEAQWQQYELRRQAAREAAR